MPLIILTFFVAISYAAPVARQGAINMRSLTQMAGERDAVPVGSVSASMRLPDEP